LPDAIGRTPLWVAIENQDKASIQLLLKAGADPLQACKFSEEGKAKSPLSVVAKSANKELFRDLLKAVIEQGDKSTPYDFDEDPFFLKHWASVHSPDDVQWLADQVKALSGTLFCCEDISGTSYFYRSVIDGSLDKKFASGNEDLIEWLRSLDVSPGTYKEFESSPLFAAASAASIQTYAKLIDFLYKKSDGLSDYEEDDMYGTYGDEDDTSDTSDIFNTSDNEDDDMYRLRLKVREKFLLSRSSEELDQFVKISVANFEKMDENEKYKKRMALAQDQYKALLEKHDELDFAAYARVVKNVWPFLTDEQKIKLFAAAAISAEDRMNFVYSMLDCALESSALEEIMHLACNKMNKAAFEFAAERSVEMAKVIESLSAGEDTGYGKFSWAVSAGSLKWVEKLIAAGFKLERMFQVSPFFIIKLADLDPEGLAEKFKNLQLPIEPHWVDQTKTEAGKQALMALIALMAKEKNNT